MTMKPVKARAWGLVLLGAVTSLVLAGCGSDTTPSDGSAPSAGASASPTEGAGGGAVTSGKDSGQASGTGSGKTSGSPSASPSTPGTDGPSSGAGSDGSAGSTDDGTGAGLEMPEAPEETVDSLSELLEPVGSTPLVTAPLPRAAQAQGRVVARFPAVLRPVRASRVESSAISPSGSRLQAGLVASTRLSPELLLVAYRTRLGGRGLIETSAPATDQGSVAVAFERGRSTVTITATDAGAGTRYVVHATLHVGGE